MLTWLRRPRLDDDRGNAAVEFALVLPLMLTLYFGSVEVTQAIRAANKIGIIAGRLGDLASQQLTCSSTSASAPCLTDAEMTGSNGIFTAATALLSPYNASNLKITISEIMVTSLAGVQIAKVHWSVTNGTGATARPCNGGGVGGSLLAGAVSPTSSTAKNYLPTSYTSVTPPVSDYYMIVADVSYQYLPGFGYQLFKWADATTAFTMAQVGIYRNRNSGSATINVKSTTGTALITSGLTSCF